MEKKIRKMFTFFADFLGIDSIATMISPDLHKRPGRSRQFESSLSEETQFVLKKKFENVLDGFGFEV